MCAGLIDYPHCLPDLMVHEPPRMAARERDCRYDINYIYTDPAPDQRSARYLSNKSIDDMKSQ